MTKKNINSRTYHLKIREKILIPSNFCKNPRYFLKEKRMFILALLENPNLLEHKSFTDLLRSVFHLTEELDKRPELYNLPNFDYDHLKKDVERVYDQLIFEWPDYGT